MDSACWCGPVHHIPIGVGRMEYSDEEVLKIGTRCLLDRLGPIDTTRFMMMVRRPRGNHTEDRKAIYDDVAEGWDIHGTDAIPPEDSVGEWSRRPLYVIGRPPRRNTTGTDSDGDA